MTNLKSLISKPDINLEKDWEWLCHKCHMTKDGRLEKFLKLPMTEERKHKMSLAKIGKPLSEETKIKLRGRTPWNKGKHYHFRDL